MPKIELIHGDCLEKMKDIPDRSIDMVLTDPPYGTTACKWDTVIPFEPMWEQLNRVIKLNGAIVLFGSEPFSSALRMSNIKNYKYDWIWEKPNGTNPFLAKYQPVKKHEIISVFNSKIYLPQMEDGEPYKWNSTRSGGEHSNLSSGDNKSIDNRGTRYPSSIRRFKQERGLHPTQKPVPLMEYLIKTYTNECETVLDFTMGSGTTGIACKNLNRNFIGIELDPEYFKIAERRMKNEPDESNGI